MPWLSRKLHFFTTIVNFRVIQSYARHNPGCICCDSCTFTFHWTHPYLLVLSFVRCTSSLSHLALFRSRFSLVGTYIFEAGFAELLKSERTSLCHRSRHVPWQNPWHLWMNGYVTEDVSVKPHVVYYIHRSCIGDVTFHWMYPTVRHILWLFAKYVKVTGRNTVSYTWNWHERSGRNCHGYLDMTLTLNGQIRSHIDMSLAVSLRIPRSQEVRLKSFF